MGGAALGGVMAGCSSEPPQAATPPPSVFRGTSFAGTDLVVDLVEDHGVEQLNLIGPDSRLFAQASVAVGETRVNLEILRIQPSPRFKHYTPGSHELVAVGSDGKASTFLELRPNLRIIDVNRPDNQDDPANLAKLIITVGNFGTGPTWIFDVTSEGAPNTAANVGLGSDPGVVLLEKDGLPESVIVLPGESMTCEDVIFPLVLPQDDIQDCSMDTEMSVIVGAPLIEPLEQKIRLQMEGSPTSVGFTGGYTCSEVAIEMVDS